MASHRPFGRRADQKFQPQRARIPARAPLPAKQKEFFEAPEKQSAPSCPDVLARSVEDEVREWARTHRQGFKLPWRQLSLMAGLCFGLASFILPDSVNDAAQWLLYALMAASFYAGLRKRKASG